MSAAPDVQVSVANTRRRVLVVDDHDGVRTTLGMRFGAAGWLVEEAADGTAAVERLGKADASGFDVVLCDLRLPGIDGRGVLAAALRVDPEALVIMMTAYATVEVAVDLMRAGARHVVQKPFDFDALCEIIEGEHVDGAEGAAGANAAVEVPDSPGMAGAGASFVARSPSTLDAAALATRVAAGRSTVLVTGETGTGKELIASLVHQQSERRRGPFVKVNCAALPETLLESELFGHERGAFTGADRRRIGRFEQAHTGTLFLDEIGETTPATQAKLLRVLQDQEFFRLGGTQRLRTDARIVAATNQDLDEAQRAGRFRQDLYFRLDVIGVHLAPLRERPEDVEGLLEVFIAAVARDLDREPLRFDEASLRALRAHPWPGNVRELRNVVERAMLTARGPEITPEDLALERRGARTPGRTGNELTAPGVSLSAMERQLVLAALEDVGWVQKEAAHLLEVSPRKLNYMIRRMGITHASWRRNRGADDDTAPS